MYNNRTINNTVTENVKMLFDFTIVLVVQVFLFKKQLKVKVEVNMEFI